MGTPSAKNVALDNLYPVTFLGYALPAKTRTTGPRPSFHVVIQHESMILRALCSARVELEDENFAEVQQGYKLCTQCTRSRKYKELTQ